MQKTTKGKAPVHILNKKALDCNPQLNLIQANAAMCYTQNICMSACNTDLSCVVNNTLHVLSPFTALYCQILV